MERKKVCMFNMGKLFDKQTGGIKRYLELYHALKANGYEVDLYTKDEQSVIESNGINGQTINVTSSKHLLNIPSLNVLLDNKKIFSQIKKEKYDYVIVFDVGSAISPCFWNVKNVCLFLRQDLIEYRRLAYRDRGMSKYKAVTLLWMGKLAESICIIRSKHIISQCQCDVDALIKRHKLLKNTIRKKISIQINNINPSWVQEEDNSIPEKQYDIVFIGNFKDNRKGHDILLPALEHLQKKGYVYSALIIGDGIQLEEYKEKYKHLQEVKFLGRINQPKELIEASRMMIVPSYSDSCPNTVLEALYYKVPVIGANSSGIPEILNNEEWLFELNRESLEDKIQKSMNEDELKRLLDSQQIRREELMFDWGKKIIEVLNTK